MNTLSQTLINMAEAVLSIFPTDPIISYLSVPNEVQSFLGYLNFFIPIGTLVSITTAWLTGVAMYYLYQIVLRWIKVIE